MSIPAAASNKYDIYRFLSDGSGPETRLTVSPGLNDGPEYTPDGKYIYFNSSRSGTMQIWRMKPEGANQEQLTDDQFQNWFPHVSPDGKWIAFLSYSPDVAPTDHPYYKQVYLRLMPVGRRRRQSDRLRLWWPGHDERPLMVTRQPAPCLRQQQRSASPHNS